MGDIKVAIAGAGGRMGLATTLAVTRTPGLVVTAAFDRAGVPAIGKDAGILAGLESLGVTVTDAPEAALAGVDAVIDFTAPAASVAIAEIAGRSGLVHVIGTTGCSEADEAAFRRAAEAGARIVRAGNFSLGVNLLVGLVREAAAALGEDYDIEIVEMHHARKVDAPSGTALMLGEAAAAGRGVPLASVAIRGRDGETGPRPAGAIGFASLRGGTVVGDHQVTFAGPGERVELAHRAEDRGIFANGAARAALWAAGHPAGFYSMADVLGFTSN